MATAPTYPRPLMGNGDSDVKHGGAAAWNQGQRERMTQSDLAAARAKGQTYNQMYEAAFQRDKNAGVLNSDAVNSHQAYELDKPAEVRARIDNTTVGAGRGNVNPPSAAEGYATGGQIGKKPNPAFKPFGSNPDAKPC